MSPARLTKTLYISRGRHHYLFRFAAGGERTLEQCLWQYAAQGRFSSEEVSLLLSELLRDAPSPEPDRAPPA